MKKGRLIILSYLIFSLLVSSLHAQFILNGSAVQTNDTCWVLTQEQDFVVGSMWFEEKINLLESFEVKMNLNFGDKQGNGADGILFGLQPVSTSIGQAGEGLGFQGVSPSVGIEFDTYQNPNLDDPTFDHLAISKNGNLDHGGTANLAGPVQADAADGNIEDGEWHQIKVNWYADQLTLEIYFDGVLRLNYVGDIVNDIFNGDPEVFWGFTSATGGANNLHQVCLTCTIFRNELEDITLCPGGQIQLETSGGSAYSWTPPIGLDNPNIPNPFASPTGTTTYIVEIMGACTFPIYDTLTVFVDGDTVALDIGADTAFCEGGSAWLDATFETPANTTYQWSNGETTAAIEAVQTGYYSVTVTLDNYCVASGGAGVTVYPLPGQINLGNDTVLCNEQTLLLDATTSGNPTYEWQNGSTQPDFLVNSPGMYAVALSNNCGDNTAAIYVDYEDCRQVFFPSAFSPNDDGLNDFFYPYDGGDVKQIRQLKIFDRWGGQVFDQVFFLTNDLQKDGMANPETNS